MTIIIISLHCINSMFS